MRTGVDTRLNMSYSNAVYPTNELFGNPISINENADEVALQNWLTAESAPIVAKAPAPSIYPVLNPGQIELSPTEFESAKFSRTWGVPTRRELSTRWQSWEKSNQKWEAEETIAAHVPAFAGTTVLMAGIILPSALVISQGWIATYGIIVFFGLWLGVFPITGAMAAFLTLRLVSDAIGRTRSGVALVRNDIRRLASRKQTEANAGQFDWLLESTALRTFLKYHKDDELEALVGLMRRRSGFEFAKASPTGILPSRTEVLTRWKAWRENNVEFVEKKKDTRGKLITGAFFPIGLLATGAWIAAQFVWLSLASQAWMASYAYVYFLTIFGAIPVGAAIVFLLGFAALRLMERCRVGEVLLRNDLKKMADSHAGEGDAGKFDWLLESSVLERFLKHHKDEELTSLCDQMKRLTALDIAAGESKEIVVAASSLV